MSENYLQIYFIGSKKKIDEIRNIFKKLGFKQEKEILNCQIETGNRAIIVGYLATNEQIENASKAFQYVEIKEIKK